ncbi:VOC family protein [Sulfitobacter mediterraneus]|uniref:Glyoxalase/bleomycin resistance protein/dioxygenase superfamily protein n=1 Tax=Sulfitobacter mediterraneus TaxID=83219 RepID=A0A2T6BZ55_9RHOB|nr:VOC family protein [Sulfitobacter mediterraneus]KIN75660.1 Glyoxalase/bleomycin resistance protein/dioxygenase [Sulfitobacter mediterraneus KCTC 32188]PTX61352.1 glyoxalase/bleomycin resistance protein/dioxygenase superfamily protein [Sulfitobacter mediterraneus]
MPIRRLDHVNVVTANLEEMVAWYEAVLGLRSGPRPDFPFGGAWLYAGDAPVVHLVEDTGRARTGSEAALKLEHFAFSATDASAFERKLAEYGDPFKRIEVPGAGLVQFHVADPDGNHVHIDFAVDE